MDLARDRRLAFQQKLRALSGGLPFLHRPDHLARPHRGKTHVMTARKKTVQKTLLAWHSHPLDSLRRIVPVSTV
jgi:hypothetical protein